jgi:hypothetical protein
MPLSPSDSDLPRGSRSFAAYAAVLLLVVASGCGKKVLVPPRFDLMPLERVGLVTFAIENARGSLHEFASQRFTEEVLRAQPGLEILELGDSARVLARIGKSRLDADAAKAIGQEYGVAAVFVGAMVVSDVKPRASLAYGPHIEAEVSVAMTVRLLSGESGATMWTGSTKARETVAEIGLFGGEPYFAAQDPDEAYGHLVTHLVYDLTYDFRPTYRRR